MDNLMDCLAKQKKVLEQLGYTVAYICVYGSQNYGLELYTEDYQSDIDMKAVVVPTLDELVRDSKPVSIVVDTEWGQCDVKDIRMYFQTLLKANPAYIETLFTKYYIVDTQFEKEFEELLSLRELLVHVLSAQFLRSIYGMMCEKEKALCHPYPSIAHKIEQFGYDGKQLHHIYRLSLLMKDYFSIGLPLETCFYPAEKEIEVLTALKLNKVPLAEAKSITADLMELAKKFKDSKLQQIDEKTMDYSVKGRFTTLSQDIIKSKIVAECKRLS